MAKVTIVPATDDSKSETYNAEFLKWKGRVDAVPVLNSAIEARADAITASWRMYGNNSKEAAAILDGVRGNGKQTFKQIFNNLWRMSYICGDAYAEVVWKNDKEIENLRILLPDDITVNIKNGEIKGYEDKNSHEKFRPQEIFHHMYNPLGPSCHGRSGIEPLNDILIDWAQLIDNMAKIFNRYIKPIHIVEYDGDDPTEISNFKKEWAKLKNIPESDIVIPKGLVSVSRASIPQGSTLDPTMFNRVLMDQIMMATRVPELALGTGSVNSEESAKMQFMGFRQAIRHDQKMLEESIKSQLLFQMYPEETPKIKFSFAAEPQEERFNRLMQQAQTVAGLPVDENLKKMLILNTLYEAGVIEDAGRNRESKSERRNTSK